MNKVISLKTSLKKGLFVLGATSLTGCVGLEIAHLTGQVLAQELSTVAYPDKDIMRREDTKVYPVTMIERRPMGFATCKYSGVMVEYARDWDDVDEMGHIVRAADSEKPVGYALLLTEETCPNSEPQEILKVGSKSFYPVPSARRFVIRERHSMSALNYAGMAKDMRPKWMPQVLRTLMEEALSNPATGEALARIEAKSELGTPIN